jgi:hypothetical protein
VTPDLDLLAQALGAKPTSWESMNAGGYTRSNAFRVTTSDGLIFAKEAEDGGSLHMLRREAVVYRSVRGAFLPAFVGFADSGERAVLAIEFLDDAHWPPPYPDDVAPLFEALELVAKTPPPTELPAEGPNTSQWEKVAADPEPFLGLGLCSREWFEDAIEALIEAEAAVEVEGDQLVHNDIYSANVGFTRSGAVLVDWGAAVRGSRWIDVAYAVLSVRVAGATRPADLELPGEASLAATITGHFAVGAPSPLPLWADPDSTFLADIAGDLRHLLEWSVELLDLPPVS